MTAFEHSDWIWIAKESQPDSYGEFADAFDADSAAVCRISVDGDYTFFINGQYVASNQYGDFEHYKCYDEIDLTPYLRQGENRLAVLVWHFGAPTQRYFQAKAGLIYEVRNGEQLLAASGTHTGARASRAYAQNLCKSLTPQLGYSYRYDATHEDAWIREDAEGFLPAVTVDKSCRFYRRPIERPRLLPRADAKVLHEENGTHFVIDLSRESVGVFTCLFDSPAPQELLITFGEHLTDGHVTRRMGSRDFSFEYRAAAGKNDFTNYMLRLGLRYLEIECELPITLAYASVIPQVYPIGDLPASLDDPRDQAIYDLCLRTLHLCMMEHYVDCPWREQCLYAFDSRNQMLCGYDALENKNASYARSNLLLMGMDRREDGLLSICSPCGIDMTIPSFSLHFVISLGEYLTHTGDSSLIRELYSKVCNILEVFVRQQRAGLICSFAEEKHWNFYDWSEQNDGADRSLRDKPDLLINALMILALESFREQCRRAELVFPFGELAASLRERAHDAFYNAESGLFTMTIDEKTPSELANALAARAEIATPAELVRIARALAENRLLPCSLSMKPFKYDAMLKADERGYRDRVLEEIRADYGTMLDAGATSTWETLKGHEDFHGAGSLCHGWSAMPIHYYHRFGMVR